MRPIPLLAAGRRAVKSQPVTPLDGTQRRQKDEDLQGRTAMADGERITGPPAGVSVTARVGLSGPDAAAELRPLLAAPHIAECVRVAKQKLSARLDRHVNYRLAQHSG